MKLTKKALELISERPVMLKLALGLSFSELWISRLIEANKENGPLTTAKSLQVIQVETGLPIEQILEEVDTQDNTTMTISNIPVVKF